MTLPLISIFYIDHRIGINIPVGEIGFAGTDRRYETEIGQFEGLALNLGSFFESAFYAESSKPDGDISSVIYLVLKNNHSKTFTDIFLWASSTNLIDRPDKYIEIRNENTYLNDSVHISTIETNKLLVEGDLEPDQTKTLYTRVVVPKDARNKLHLGNIGIKINIEAEII